MTLRYGQGREWQPSGGAGPIWRIDGLIEPQDAGVRAPEESGAERLRAWVRRLRLVRGVGPVRERRLQASGYPDLVALQRHPAYGADARQAWGAVVERRLEELRRRKVREGELLSMYEAADLVFFDIETLGLAPVFPVFLAGLLRAEREGWRCTLLLARTPEEEPALLAGAETLLREGRAVVTYNGRGFDVPFLAMRRAVNGQPAPAGWPGVAVLDLLGEARRRFKGVLGDARLETVDRYLRWARPAQGLPSRLVPEHYRRFVESGDPAWIEPVLEHNLQDLLAMANLWGVVADALDPAWEMP